MSGEIVRCPSCGQANRLPPVGASQKAVCGKCKTPLRAATNDSGGHVEELSDSSFGQQTSTGSMLVDFWAPWCGPCRTIGPVIEALAAERRDVRFGKLNVDDNPRTAARYRVQGIPLLVFLRDGVERGRLVGAVPRVQIEAAIRQHFG